MNLEPGEYGVGNSTVGSEKETPPGTERRRAGGRWMASGPWALELEGPRAGAALAGEIAPEALVVHEGGRVRAEVAPALWARVAGEMTDIRLAAPTSLVLEPAALHVPLTPGGAAGSGTMAIIDLPAVRLGGTLRADRLAVDGLTWPGRWAEAPAEVHELVAVLEPFRLDAAARVDWRARIVRSREGAAPESVAVVGEVTARSLLEDPALVQARGRLDAVPGRWLADLDARAGPWLDAAGGRLEAAEFTLQPQGTGIDWTLGLKAPRFSFEGGGAWEGGVLRLDEGMRLAGSVAPETWERWMGGSGWRLTAPGRVALSFEASHLALDADSNAEAGLDLARTGGGVALALEGFELAGPGGRPRRLGPFELTARGPALTGPLELAFEGGWKGGGERGTEAGEEDGGAPEAGAGGAVQAAPGEEAAPDWRGRVQVSDLLRPDGTLDWEAVAAEAQVSLGRLPVPLIDRIAGADGLLAETLGPEARVALEGAWPGAIALEMHSPRASARLSAHLNREHVLTLAEDAVVEFTVSPGLAEALLKWGNPVLIDASASEEPVVLTAREGFTLPVRNFDIERWAGTLTLQAGSLVLQDSWLLTALAGELGRLGSGLFPWDRRQAVHATPLQVRVKEGRVTTNDMWLTGESLHLGTRGTVDLAARTADFKVGISGWMLRQAKFLRPVIEPDAVYVLHARGPIDKLEPDVGDLVIQLLSLRGRGELTRAAGEWGALLEAGLGALVKGIRQYETEVPWPNRPPPPEVGEAALDGEGEAGEAAEEGAAQKPQEPAPERRDPIKEGLRELFRALE